MIMPPRVRKTTLILHVGASVGWLGAVTAFLVLAVTAMTTEDEWAMRAAYTSMDVIGSSALVPLSFAALVTGIIQSLGTPWGLIRHYWVLMKLLITVIATGILLLYMGTLRALAEAAQDPATPIRVGEALPNLSPVLHAGAALIVLLIALVLSIYKPRGLTGLGLERKSDGAVKRRSQSTR